MVEAIEHQSSLNSLLVDALPYIDHGYDEPGVREAVRAFLLDSTKVSHCFTE